MTWFVLANLVTAWNFRHRGSCFARGRSWRRFLCANRRSECDNNGERSNQRFRLVVIVIRAPSVVSTADDDLRPPILPLVTASLVANAGPMPVRLAPPTRVSVFQTYSAAQHFHRVSADSNVGDLLTFACRAHKNLTRPPSFDPLVHENL